MSTLLRESIAKSESLLAIERATGVKRASLRKFLRGEQSLRLDKADDLIAYFGVKVAGSEQIENAVQDRRLRQFRVKPGTDLESIPILPFALRMMMTVDAMKSSFRWYRMLDSEPDRPATSTDRLMSIVIGAGWAGEAIVNLLPHGIRKNYIRRKMLDQSDRRRFWDECTAEQKSPVVAKLIHVRNNYFGHFLPNAAKALIRNVASNKIEDTFIEWDERTFISTRFTWATMAIAHDLSEFKNGKPSIPPHVIAKAAATTSFVLEELIARMLAEHGVPFESARSRGS